MFHGRLNFSDLAAPVDPIDGGLVLGESRLTAFGHRMLRSELLVGEARAALVCYERFAGDPEGFHVRHVASEAEIDGAVADLDDYLLDYAAVVVDRRRRRIAYRASSVVSIPAYLIADADGVSIDWDYSRLLAGRPVAIDWDIAMAQVAGFSTYGAATVMVGMVRTVAGATITIDAGGVDVALPTPVRHDAPHDVAPGADPGGELFGAIRAIVEARPIDASRTAVELSGGMDSALVALAAAAGTDGTLMSLGAQFAGSMGEAQRARRSLLRDAGGFDDLSVPAERFAPFSPSSLRRVRYGVLPEDENYPELFEAMFALLRSAGIDTILSGLGGDELYIAYRGEAGAPSDDDPATFPFLSREGVAAASRGRGRYPTGWLQETCWSGAASQSQRVLRYGLWPIHPYHHPALARFVSRLPRRYRQDRRLLRDLLGSLLGTDTFAADYVKETFRPVALRGIVENRDYLSDLIRRSPLSRHPGLDDRALLEALAGDLAALDRPTYEALFRALKLFCFFQ